MSGSDSGYREALRRAANFLREGNDFLVVSHQSPDGDAVSSMSAVGLILQSLGKRYRLINEGTIPDKFRMLLGGQPITDYTAERPSDIYRRAVAVDCADFARLGAVARMLADGAELLNIDHHPTNDGYGTVNLIRTDAAATAEIVHDLVLELAIPWTGELATCIYAGLLTDTGGFRYSNTTPNVLSVAERMLRHGADGPALSERLLETLTFEQVLLLREALSTLSFTDDRRIAWMSVSGAKMAELGATDEDTEGLVNIPRNIEGVEVGILFKERDGGAVKVSLRSAGKVDVSRIAKRFGGGGHVRAAGCTVPGSVSDVIARMVEAVRSEL